MTASSSSALAASQRSQLVSFVLLSIGVLVFFILASLWEESITSRPGFRFGWFLTLVQMLCMTGFALAERWYYNEPRWQHNAPLSRHWIVAGAMTVSRGLTNVSLLYLNYPTQVVFKSLKLLTVMIGSVIWVGRSYAPMEYVATFLTVCSAALFGLGDVAVSPKFEWIGIIIVLLSLVGDSMHSNSQETLLQDHKASIRETMVYSNFFSALCCLAVTIVTGELFTALAFCRDNPVVWVLIPAQSLLQYLGVLCFVTSIKSFGVVLATTVTTVRKILTVLLSFFIYPKPFNDKYKLGIVLFFASFAIQYVVQTSQMQKGLGIGHQAGNSKPGAAAAGGDGGSDDGKGVHTALPTTDMDDNDEFEDEIPITSAGAAAGAGAGAGLGINSGAGSGGSGKAKAGSGGVSYVPAAVVGDSDLDVV